MKTTLRILGHCLLVFSIILPAFAGNTGKIIGRATDKATGQPIPGVNILVVNTTRGASTDPDGRFTIIGVPIGSYTVRASAVGYAQVEATDVKILADQTTEQNFQLSSSEVQLKEVRITADQLLVNKLTTSSTQTVSEKSIQSIPNVKSVEDILKLQAGVVKQGNNIFLRGGRANEVQYIVDGVSTNSIVGNSGGLLATQGVNQELSKYYAGIQSGSIGGGSTGVAVSASAIQSVSVQSSGFDADLGNAQSGIINIVTKSGGDKYTSSVQMRSDRFGSNSQNESYGAFSLGGPEPLTKYVFPSLGITIPGSLTFFFNGDMNRSDTYRQYAHNDFYNPIERKIELNGLFGGLLNGLGFKYRDNQYNLFTFNTKLRYDISTSDQVSYSYIASVLSQHDYGTGTWKYRADSSLLGTTLSLRHNLFWQHFFGEKMNSFIRVNLARLEQEDRNEVAGLTPPEYSSARENLDVNGDNFSELGMDQKWYHAMTTVHTIKIDLNSQVHPLHLLKAGFEYNYEAINSTEIQYPTAPHYGTLGNEIPLPDPDPNYADGEWAGFGWYRPVLNNYDSRGAFYVQDNIEFSGLNLHVGLRYDYLDIGRQVYDPRFIRSWKDDAYKWIDSIEGASNPPWVENLGFRTVTNPDGTTDQVSNGLYDGTRFWYYLTHGYFSPRLSIGYPVTDRIVFYFNYGHFLQFPDRDNYYRFAYALQGGSWFGNPSLKPQRTVQYEAGFEDQVTDDMAFAVHAFYKDVFDYSTALQRGSYYVYKNLDYASTRGFEITLNQVIGENFSLNLSYSYQIAKGRSSNPLAGIFQPDYQLPRETRLDWDQNHTANVFASYRVGPREEGHLFGLPFVNNYGISLTWNFGSGFPYDGFNPAGRPTARTVYLKNSETKPYTTTVNLSMYKGFSISENLNLLATLDILNLLDRRNVHEVYNYTGRPYQYGDAEYNPSGDVVYQWRIAEHDLLYPTRFEPPRQIIFGVKLNWE